MITVLWEENILYSQSQLEITKAIPLYQEKIKDHILDCVAVFSSLFPFSTQEQKNFNWLFKCSICPNKW